MQTAAGRPGRPRSEEARAAVLRAVDDLLVEVGYAAVTMKGVAERAGVGRQTVYRWWSNTAEILFEASVEDAREELSVAPTGDAHADLLHYARALTRFLTRSPAGAAYRALLGEAQHDPQVAQLLAGRDVLLDTARELLHAVSPPAAPAGSKSPATGARQRERAVDDAAALLIGPVLFWVATGRSPRALPLDRIVAAAVAALPEAGTP